MQSVHAAVAPAAQASLPAIAPREPVRREPDDERLAGCPACGARHGHDFGRVAVRERSAEAVQPKLVVGAADDRLEREADAAAELVMRAPADGAALPCSGCEGRDDDDTLRRQIESPYSPDDGVITPDVGS